MALDQVKQIITNIKQGKISPIYFLVSICTLPLSVYEVFNINKEISPTGSWSLINPALLRINRQNIILRELQHILAKVKVKLLSTT